MKSLTAIVLMFAGLGVGLTGTAHAAESTPAQSAPAKKPPVRKPAKKEAPSAKAPEVEGMQATAFHCELGNQVTVYRAADDDAQISVFWNKQLHQLARVGTTTGANRFEDKKSGLVWIGIPAKSMLLDAKKGQQLANECRSEEQQVQQAAPQGAQGTDGKGDGAGK